jgi:hypothetical protein
MWSDLRRDVEQQFARLVGVPWERVEWAMAQGIVAEQAYERERQLTRYTSVIEREMRRTRRAKWRKMARQLAVSVRACGICGRMFERTLFEQAEGKTSACSPACKRLAAGSWPLFAIGSQRDTLTGWAKRYGVEPATVKHRMKRGLSIEQALTAPITPPAKRRWPDRPATSLRLQPNCVDG